MLRLGTRTQRYSWAHPRRWSGRLIQRVGDGPLVHLPVSWRQRLRKPWKIRFVRAVDSWVAVPWALYILRINRPPGRMMTDEERTQLTRVNTFISAHQQHPQWVRWVDYWDRTWLQAQLAADARARSKLEPA